MKRVAAVALAQMLLLGCTGRTLSAGTTSRSDAASTSPNEEGPSEAGESTGTSAESSTGPAFTPLPPPVPGSCESLTVGTQIDPVSDAQCAQIALGRWQLCSVNSDAGGLLPSGDQGAGVEFDLSDAGALDFLILEPGEGDGTALVPSTALGDRGFVDQPSTWTAGSCHYWLAPTSMSGEEYGWTIERFENPDVLVINNAYWYVPAS